MICNEHLKFVYFLMVTPIAKIRHYGIFFSICSMRFFATWHYQLLLAANICETLLLKPWSTDFFKKIGFSKRVFIERFPGYCILVSSPGLGYYLTKNDNKGIFPSAFSINVCHCDWLTRLSGNHKYLCFSSLDRLLKIE